MSDSYEIVSFYRFASFPKLKLKQMQKELLQKGEELRIVGLILLSTEGINVTVSGRKQDSEQYLREVEKITGIKDFFIKKSLSSLPAFKKIRVKLKKEIISFKKKASTADFSLHDLEPNEWEFLLNEKSVTVLDIRNDYEVEVGRFKKAKDLGLKEFSEFPEKIKQSSLPKEQKTLLYCTGGIRSEKAIAEMRKQGFRELYQLKGGIIHYLKSFPHKSYEGECFVFDHRVAVDQNLSPSRRYSLCPHCGQAADKKINCVHCKKPTKICKHCLKKNLGHLMTCTKNCSYHFEQGHKCKKPHPLKNT